MKKLERFFARPRVSRGANQIIEDCVAILEQESQIYISSLQDSVMALDEGWERKIEDASPFLMTLAKARVNLKATSPSDKKTTKPDNALKLLISSLFLRKCHEYLCSDPKMHERLHLVTGPITPDGIRILSGMEKVKLRNQSGAFVEGDAADTHLTLVKIDESGHTLHAVCHSHMSRGAESTQPSQTDIKNQDRLVQMGCDAIAGIFSLDGFVRYFSTCKDFDLQVFGTGVKLIEDQPRMKVFKLEIGESR